MKKLCFKTATPEEIVLLGRHGDKEALQSFWESTLPTIDRIAGFFHRRYPWVDKEDISQSLSLDVPKIIRRFDPGKAKQGVARYVYISLYRAAQDVLRREDPLGVRIPQKRGYPKFMHLNTKPEEDNRRGGLAITIDTIINKGIDNLDRGYLLNMEDRHG